MNFLVPNRITPKKGPIMRSTLILSTLAIGLAATASHAAAPTDTLKGRITVNKTLDTNKTWIISGYVLVDSGATLTVNPGTQVQGQVSTKGTLAIARGSKLVAEGTKEMPITFTSDEPAGAKTRGSWGGIVILGKAKTNLTSAPTFEAFSDWAYGGTDDADSSGSLKYIRIENPGFPVAPDKELNGLTLCTVGNKTKVSYIQVHNGDDDGVEFFGGTVNADHLLVTNQVDDGFDSDNGFTGTVSWSANIQGAGANRIREYLIKDANGIIIKNAAGGDSIKVSPPEVVGDKCFESSSTKVAAGAATPQTNPTWSHITAIDNGKSGGVLNLNEYAAGTFDHVLFAGDSSDYAVKLDGGANGNLLLSTPSLKFVKSYLGGTFKADRNFVTDDATNATTIKDILKASLKQIKVPLYKDLGLANDSLIADSVGAFIGSDASTFWYQGWTLPGSVSYAKGMDRTTGIYDARSDVKANSELLTLGFQAGSLILRSTAMVNISVEVVDIKGNSLYLKKGIRLSVGENHLGKLWGNLPTGSHYLVVRSGDYSLHQKLKPAMASQSL
jgi:hypothetical protein